MKREFKLNVDKEKFMASGPVLFGCYMQAGLPVGLYEECSDVPRLATLFARHLSDYNEAHASKMDLVFFADAGARREVHRSTMRCKVQSSMQQLRVI
jgi:hypothetical protein